MAAPPPSFAPGEPPVNPYATPPNAPAMYTTYSYGTAPQAAPQYAYAPPGPYYDPNAPLIAATPTMHDPYLYEKYRRYGFWLVLIGLLLIPAGITIFVLLIVKRTGYIFVTPLVVSICGAIMVARGARFYTQAKQYA